MPFRVKNNKTGHVYTVGVVSDDETDVTSAQNPALTPGGQYVPAVYGDDASDVTAPTKPSKADKSGGTN